VKKTNSLLKQQFQTKDKCETKMTLLFCILIYQIFSYLEV